MIFIEPNDYDGNTDYNASMQEQYRHLLLPFFQHQFVKGKWGCYVSLWLEAEDFTFWLHYFFRQKNGKMLTKVAETTYALNHMLAGRIFGMLNDGIPVELAPDRSHFFIIPADYYQYAIIDKGESISMHIDYKREYLDKHWLHYAALCPLLEAYDQNPRQAFCQGSIMHNYQAEHAWRKVYEMLGKVADPVLFLEAQVRELLRLHYEQVAASVEMKMPSEHLLRIKPEHLKAIHEARKIIESNIAVTNTIEMLSRKVGMNVSDLKRVFKEVYGSGIYQYLLQLRMSFAWDLVLSTDKTNREIAALCGVKNVSHFVYLFRKTFGITPGELRHQRQS